MTREEAKEAIKEAYGNSEYTDEIIKALEQEPVIDKIRTEIERLQKMCDKDDLNLLAQYSAFGMVLDVIDEYKPESEVEE